MWTDDHVRKVAFINAILAALGILTLAASLNPGWFLWGLSSAGYFPGWLRIVICAALIALCIPPIFKAIANYLSLTAESISEKQWLLIYGAIFIALMLLFYIFSSKNHLLGDGYIILGTITQGKMFSPTEPLDYFLHHLVFALIGGETGAHLSYVLTGYLSGAAFILIIFLFFRNKAGFVFSLGAAFGFAVMQYFFGYVENYTVSLVLIFLYLVYGWRDLSGNKVSPVTIVILALAIGFNVHNAIFILSLAYLFLRKNDSPRLMALCVSLIIILPVLGLIYLRLFTQLNILEIFVPPIQTSQNPYYLLSARHIGDLLNLMLLDFPLLIICPLILSNLNKPEKGYLIWTVIPALIFVIAIDPRLGAPRDWDMMSLPTAPILAFILTSFGQEDGKLRNVRYGIVIPLFLFAFLHTGSWVWQNSDKDAGYSWLKPLVQRDAHYASNYFHGFRNKSWANIVATNTADTSEVIRADQMRYRGDPDDTLNTCNLAGHYFRRNDTAMVLQIIGENWRRYANNPNAISVFGAQLINLKRYPEAETLYAGYLRTGGTDPRILHDLGSLLERRGAKDSAYVLYYKAFENWPDAPPGMEFTFYLKCLIEGYTDMMRSGLKKVMPKLPDYVVPPVNDIIRALDAGNKARADSLAIVLNKRLVEEGKQ